jgi:hypothetical protein
LTANGVAGGYLGTAGVGGSVPPATYNLTNITAVSSATFAIPNRGGMLAFTAGLGSTTTGYAKIVPDNGKTTPPGFAITAFRANGVLISEFTIPATPPISGGRMYVDTVGSVNTGLILANANAQSATIDWSATDLAGTDTFSGSFNLNANGQMAIFLNQSPINVSNFQGTFAFSSNVAVTAAGLRLLVNERTEFVFTSTPVFNTSAPLTTSTGIIPAVLDGDGLKSLILLQNPTDSTITGNIQFLDETGTAFSLTANGQTLSSFPYSIPRRSVFKLLTAGTTDVFGSAHVIPTPGHNTPYISEIVSSRQNNVTVTEVSGAATTGTALRTYAEASGSQSINFPTDTFVAVANTTANAAVVTFELTDLAGNTMVAPIPMNLAPNGVVELQLGFFDFPPDIKGVLRITSTTTVSVTAVRIHVNERSEFLLSSLPVINEAAATQATPLIIPHFGSGGGFSAQFVVFSGFANQDTSGQLQFFNSAGNPLNLDIYAKPSILAIVPSSGLINSTISATIYGMNLSGATAVNFSGTGVTGLIGGGTQTSLPVTITVDALAQATTRTITVTTTAGTSTVFTGFTVTSGLKKRSGQLTSQ